MTFKDLLLQYSFEEIKSSFVTLWKFNAPQQAGHLDFIKWTRIYQNIQAVHPSPTNGYIRLSVRWESCTPMIDMNCVVYSKKDNRLICPMACYPSWSEIAGMEIRIDKDVEISPQELAAGLLWEITYYGGTEESAGRNRKRLFHR